MNRLTLAAAKVAIICMTLTGVMWLFGVFSKVSDEGPGYDAVVRGFDPNDEFIAKMVDNWSAGR